MINPFHDQASYAALKDPQKPVEEQADQKHRIRITLTSTNMRSLEKGMSIERESIPMTD